jgi:hypothetical protein
MAAERPASWSRAQRILHWAIAALVLLAAPMGVYMVALPFRQLLLKFRTRRGDHTPTELLTGRSRGWPALG